MTKVELQGISKQFGDFTALKSLDCTIESGELVALLGPSGCGKTTTLRMIAGLESPTTGGILFDGEDISPYAVQERNVGMVFQRYALFPHMSVAKNITFGLDVSDTKKQEIAHRLEEILDIVQLQDFRDRFPSQLSGGQMQRVAIARTLITKPSVLMMDEPLANLDTKLRGEMRTFIKKLQRQFNITTIFVTHDQIEAMELADRIAVIFDGELAQYDTPEVIYNTPNTLAIADFMGADNIMPGVVVSPTQVKTDFANLTANALTKHNCTVGDTIHVVLRSEAIALSHTPLKSSHTRQVIQGTIVACDFFGATMNYTITCGDSTLNVRQQGPRLLTTGTDVWLGIDTDCIWLIKD